MADTELRSMVHAAIAEEVGPLYASVVDHAADAVMKIIESVHENALGYGRLLGEEVVLDALIEGRLSKPAARHWWEGTKAKIETGRQVERSQS